MPTRWMFSELIYESRRVLYFGHSFNRCDLPSNQSCILSNKYYHGNDTDNDISDEAYNMTHSCGTYNDSAMTWYYLHVRRLINVSLVHLKFNSDNESESESALNVTVPSCTNVSLRIPPFGTVPYQNREDMLRWMHKKSNDIRFDTFRISGIDHQCL